MSRSDRRPTSAWLSSWRDPVTLDFTPGSDPVDVVAELSLQAGTTYRLQNVDSRTVLLVREAQDKPAAGARAHRVPPGGDVYVEPAAGFGIWCWSSGDPVACVVTGVV